MVTQSRMSDDADAGFEQRERDLRAQFLPKLKRVLAHVPFALDLLAAYYTVLDRETPMRVRMTLAAALAYFVLPFDIIPDFMVGLGYTDDAAILFAAIRMVSGSMQQRHYDAAQRWLDEAKKGQ
ncbi:YkvA family protein [Labrys okinawensis]|uniref:YkvA family protein n=1 Tax=Labrys okinawensis TaxID=346911 RepID=UPI0039BC87A3